jgi:hypothetical protein
MEMIWIFVTAQHRKQIFGLEHGFERTFQVDCY